METLYYVIDSKCFISSLVTVMVYYVGELIFEIESPYGEIESTIKKEFKNDSIKLVELV